MNRLFQHTAFAVGLLAIVWVGAGYVPGNPLALVLVLLIGAFYGVGALELHRFQQATGSLAQAVSAAQDTPGHFAGWLARLHPGLRHAVRLRVEGERVGLPGPALTPYLAGLLVLLGMLGTFLGMVLTLKGTGLALESATDVDTIRASLAAPVRGLGLAFGTSVAGVAASAMLGLMSALVRRERQGVAQQLDARIATTLRGFSQAFQREESLQLLRAQAEAMPAVVTQLQTLVAQLERQGQALHDGLLASQAAFQGDTQRAFTGLAESVDRSLKASLTDSARLAGAAIEPAVRATMAGLAQEATSLRDALSGAVQQQLEGVTVRLDTTTAALAERWQAALADQKRHGDAAAVGLQAGLERFTQTFEQRSATLVDGLAERLDRSADTWAESWGQAQAALADQQRQGEAVTQGLQAGLERFTQTFEQRSATLVDGMAERLDRSAGSWADSWGQAVAQQRQGNEALLQHTREASAAVVAGFEHHAASLLRSVSDARAEWDTAAAVREEARMAAFHNGLATMTTTLHDQARQDGSALAERQQQICTTLEHTANTIAAQAEAHARATIGEIAQLVQTASEAPRAAAEVIGELRRTLSDSLVRDNTALDERNRLMATLGSLLDAVNHASTEQRAAIDALVNTTTEVLERAGTRFAERVEAESRTLQAVADQVTGSAAEVASLGEGFGLAVDLFSRSSEQLTAQLQRIEGALGHSLARSDEQLAYYVAQAREIVDLTLGSQQQIFQDLQRLAKAPVEADAA
jgi:hypothetical protein